MDIPAIAVPFLFFTVITMAAHKQHLGKSRMDRVAFKSWRSCTASLTPKGSLVAWDMQLIGKHTGKADVESISSQARKASFLVCLVMFDLQTSCWNRAQMQRATPWKLNSKSRSACSTRPS